MGELQSNNDRTFKEGTMYPSLLVMFAVAILALSTQSALSQQPLGFDASRFDWTDPQNWDRVMNPSGTQTWRLRDEAARAYLRQAIQTGQYCNYSYRAASRYISLRIPKISPACAQH